MADLTLEWEVAEEKGHHAIAGLDEAGRGALAGPVVAAAVVLPLGQPEKLATLAPVNDSKQLTAKQRERFFTLIQSLVLACGVGIVAASQIDSLGIIAATKLAMRQALRQLSPAPRFLLIDGRIRLSTLAIPQRSIVRGDSRSLSIAAASILAKVTRDRLLVELGVQYPAYGLAEHKGYGTEKHRLAIEEHGPTPIHRHTFAPIRKPML